MRESYGVGDGERFTTKEMCEVLGISIDRLKSWRIKKIGPPYVRLGRIYYPKGAFEEWLKARMHNL